MELHEESVAFGESNLQGEEIDFITRARSHRGLVLSPDLYRAPSFQQLVAALGYEGPGNVLGYEIVYALAAWPNHHLVQLRIVWP